MYQVLRNGTVIINANDMDTAIHFVKSMESQLDRNTQHSPYVIRKVDESGALDMSDSSPPKAVWPPVAGPSDWPCPR